MNINLITKLAKLANNNPNENEANLAARKVCKLLAEGKFQFGATAQEASYGSSGFDAVFNAAQRQTQQDKWWYNRDPRQYDIPKEQEERARANYYAQQNAYQQNYNPYTRQDPKRKLKCTKCGINYVIDFNGSPEQFICLACALRR